MISQELLNEIRQGFVLSLDGIHGEPHWARVRENGLYLAERISADPAVVEFFAYLHDSQRQSDGWDKEHGLRAAEFLRGLTMELLPLSNAQRELLAYACAHHSDGFTEADVSVQACWDADRLDLGRIGIEPDARYLCTPLARDPEIIAWAFRRSKGVGQGFGNP